MRNVGGYSCCFPAAISPSCVTGIWEHVEFGMQTRQQNVETDFSLCMLIAIMGENSSPFCSVFVYWDGEISDWHDDNFPNYFFHQKCCSINLSTFWTGNKGLASHPNPCLSTLTNQLLGSQRIELGIVHSMECSCSMARIVPTEGWERPGQHPASTGELVSYQGVIWGWEWGGIA